MKKTKHNGYNGYMFEYRGYKLIVWNGSYNTTPEWYVTQIEGPTELPERDLYYDERTMKSAVQRAKELVDAKRINTK
jgi:hypothetical protein